MIPTGTTKLSQKKRRTQLKTDDILPLVGDGETWSVSVGDIADGIGPLLPISEDVAAAAEQARTAATAATAAAQQASDVAADAANIARGLSDADDPTKGAALVAFKGPLENEVAKNVYLNFIEVCRVSRWGVDPERTAAENTELLRNAIAAKTKARFVYRDGDYHVNDVLAHGAGNLVYHEGDGAGVSRLVQDNLTADLLRFDINFAQGGGIDGLTLTSNVDAGAAGSSGIALNITNANDSFIVRNFEILSYQKQIELNGCYQVSIDSGRLLYYSKFAIHYSPYTGGTSETSGNRWRNLKVSNFGYTGLNPELALGLWMEQGSGEFFETVDITQSGRAVLVQPPRGSWCRFLRFTDVMADTSLYEGWTLDGTTGAVFDVEMMKCYSAGSGGGVFRPTGSDRGAGLVTLGDGLDDVRWIVGTLRDNDCGGWTHRGGTNIRLLGTTISRNSRRVSINGDPNPPGFYNNTYPGVRISNNAGSCSLFGCTIGNVSLGVFNVEQAEAIVIDPGTSDNIMITGNRLDSPGPGHLPISNGTSGSNVVISNNTPKATLGTNLSDRIALGFGSITKPPVNFAGFLTSGGFVSDVRANPHVLGQISLVVGFYVGVSDAPGAGETFTYTAFHNGAKVDAMTGTNTGTSQFVTIVTSGSFRASPTDELVLELRSSANATPTYHRGYWIVEP
ncbi:MULTISPECIES: hypothetical protein [Burkholderia]|uniref:hypothetical protein n=1 Tax=Burkholderia TaxID=32008 RepID=UPI000F5FED6F|nr:MULTISPECIES: hypothetical protein [Burkholderia]RQZ74789.1 hypothetical protein DF052_06800 [Burkholderia glumae]